MAAAKGDTPGGVVSIQAIIDQIYSVNTGLEAIVDAVLDSTNVIVLAAKVKIAKKKLASTNAVLTDFIRSVDEEIKAMLEALEPKEMSKDIEGLIANPAEFQKNMSSKPEEAVKLLANKTNGILEVVVGVAAALNLISELNVPSSRKISRKMKRMNSAINAVKNNMQSIVGDLNELDEISKNASNGGGTQEVVTAVQSIVGSVAEIIGYIALIALLTPILTITAPIAVLGVITLEYTIKGMIWALENVSDPKVVSKANRTMSSVKRLLHNILSCIMYMAGVFAAIALVVILCVMVGQLIIQSFVPFLAGLATIAVLFGILMLSLNFINKIAKKASKTSLQVLVHMLILCAVLVILAMVFMLLATVANMVNGNIMSILILLGLIALVLLGMMGFMALAAAIAPALAVGFAAIALVMVAVVVLLVLTLALMTLVWVAQMLDPDAVMEAVDKVMMCAEFTVQSLLNADFTTQEKKSDGGIIRSLIGLVGGDSLLAIFDLIVKVVILFLTLMAVGLLFVLTAVLVEFVKYYEKNKTYIDKVTETINAVITACANVIQTVLTSDTGARPGDDDGLFLTLVGFVLGPDVVSIFKLLFKVIIVMLTIVVLLMVRVVMQELVWIHTLYEKLGGPGFFGPEGTAVLMMRDIMGGCQNVINAVLNPQGEEMTGGDGLLIALVNFVSPDLGTILELLFKVVIIALTMAVLAMIKIVMDELKWIHDAYTEIVSSMGASTLQEAVTVMVNDIMGAVDSVIRILTTKPDEPEGKPRSGLQKLLDFVGLSTLADVVGLLCSFIRIGLAILALSVLMSVAKIMRESWETYQAMGGENIAQNATNMVYGLVNGLNAMVRAMKNADMDLGDAGEKDEGKFHWKIWNVAYNVLLRIVKGIFGSGITGVIDLVNAAGTMRGFIPILSTLTFVTQLVKGILDDTKKNIPAMDEMAGTTIPHVIELMSQMVDTINSMEIGDLEKCDKNLQDIQTTCQKISRTFNEILGGNQGSLAFAIKNARDYGKVVSDTGRLVNRINGLNIAKMKALADMFGNAAAFAQAIDGNFDRLADVINEKLAPILEGLKQTIEDADKHIEEYTKRQEQVATKQQSVFAQFTQSPAPGGVNPTAQGAAPNKAITQAAQADIQSQIEGALRSFFRTTEGSLRVTTR